MLQRLFGLTPKNKANTATNMKITSVSPPPVPLRTRSNRVRAMRRQSQEPEQVINAVTPPSTLSSAEVNVENIVTNLLNTTAAPSPSTPVTPVASSNTISNVLTIEEKAVIPFYNIMSTDAKVHFKPQINQIRSILTEMKTLTGAIADIQLRLESATRRVKGIKGPNVGNASFRGRNAPALYVSPIANGKDFEARINFMVNGYPQRASNLTSFNSVLAQMKTKTRNIRAQTGPLRGLIAEAKKKQGEYNTKQQELAKLAKKLQKDHEEYIASHAKMVRSSRKTYQPGVVPQSLTLAEAEQTLAPSTAPRSRFSLFGKRGGSKRASKRGGTRRRSASRKTRKNRRNNRK